MFTAYILFNCRPWNGCRWPDSVPFEPKGLNYSLEVTFYDSMLPVYRRLFDENLKILVYSGQGDPTTSHVGMLVLSLASDKIAEVVISQHGQGRRNRSGRPGNCRTNVTMPTCQHQAALSASSVDSYIATYWGPGSRESLFTSPVAFAAKLERVWRT